MNIPANLVVSPGFHPAVVARGFDLADLRTLNGVRMGAPPAWARAVPRAIVRPYGAGWQGGGLAGPLPTADQTIAGLAQAGADLTATILVALGTVGGPVGAAIAGVAALGMQIANLFGGCGQTCVQASNIANQIEPVLLQNLNQYLQAPVRYRSLQLAALNNFDTAWAALAKACGAAALQQAGVNCIADRQSGACKWQASPNGWSQNAGTWTYTPAGPAGSGTMCWNWFVGYRDPIANDPGVVPDPVSSSVNNAINQAVGGSTAPGAAAPDYASLLLILAVAGMVVYFV